MYQALRVPWGEPGEDRGLKSWRGLRSFVLGGKVWGEVLEVGMLLRPLLVVVMEGVVVLPADREGLMCSVGDCRAMAVLLCLLAGALLWSC